MNAGVLLAVVLGIAVLMLVALFARTRVVKSGVYRPTAMGLLRRLIYWPSQRAQAARALYEMHSMIREMPDQMRSIVAPLEQSVLLLTEMQLTIQRSVESAAASDPAEVSDRRIVAELNHALQTPLRGLNYAFQNLENLPDDVLIHDRAKRVSDMTAMLDSCTSALATFRGLVDTVASVPARQPSLDEAVRAFAGSIPYPTGEPMTVDLVGLPDRIDGFSNHYLLTLLQPLVENAIEGCSHGGRVEVTCTDHGDAVEFTVFNPIDHPVDEDVLFAPERTTKSGHQGLGVSIVARLAEFERGDLIADITDTSVRMRVVLPRR